MIEGTRVRIILRGGVLWDITVRSENLKAVDGLPSGKLVTMERRTGDVQVEQVMIRPYYRRMIDGQQHIFAIQVKSNEEKRHGK